MVGKLIKASMNAYLEDKKIVVENAFVEYINQEKQKELLKIEENIRKANERLNERIKEAKASQNK